MSKPRLLDLFCGAGGCSVGYSRAGFDVVGVDLAPQRHYPFEFHQADALEYVADHGHEYDVIHASPPCQQYTRLRVIWGRDYSDYIAPIRQLLESTGKPYVIENVPSAPLQNALMLCGTMFGLRIIRHRLFETNPPIYFAPAMCHHYRPVAQLGRRVNENECISMAGHFPGVEDARKAVEIDWMTRDEMAQAIPPAYTEYIGRQLMAVLK